MTATTVRRDLAGLGSFGTRGAGYDVQVLIERIAEALGHDRLYDVVVVGIGNLGRALVNSSNFLIRGARLVALYDNDPEVVGHEIAGHVVKSLERPDRPATVGVICTPGGRPRRSPTDWSKRASTRMLNFAPQVLTVPIGTAVHYVDFSIELQILMYHLNNGTGPLGGGLLHSLGIASPIRCAARNMVRRWRQRGTDICGHRSRARFARSPRARDASPSTSGARSCAP